MTAVTLNINRPYCIIMWVMIMYSIKRFIEETILIIIVTIIGLSVTKQPFVCMTVAGIMLCLSCERSLTEERIRWHLYVEVVLSFVFVYTTGCYLAFLIFIMQVGRKRYIPGVLCFLWQLIFAKEELAIVICQAVIVTLLVYVIYGIWLLSEKYITARNHVSQSVSATAVNEMYAKKLNQELIIKNYLADKNARLEERENISRNIHNSVGHSITAAIMTLDAADMLFDTSPEKAREKMNTANERIRTSLAAIRQAVRVLDSDNKFVSMNDFVSELTAVTDSFIMDTMIKVHTDFDKINKETLIPHEHTEFLTGALKEFLSNGVRHGGADTFIVTLITDSKNIRLKVTDNGISDFSENNRLSRIENGYGLKKIDSYVRRCGGSAFYQNDNGFSAEISIKLFEEDFDE